MDRPVSLIGKTVGGSYICEKWELRVTARCLSDDLNAASDADFEAVRGLEIVKAFIKGRERRSYGTREVTPLSCGRKVWVVAQGDDHRGATLHDREQEVIWLLAYGRHRSGTEGDFFPCCKELDAEHLLLPTEHDYERLLVERDRRFVEAVRVEAPIILREARSADGEYRSNVGGRLGAGLCVELDGDLDATAMTVAFHANAIEYEQGVVLLAALCPGQWDLIGRMPSRELEPGEVAFTIMLSSGVPV